MPHKVFKTGNNIVVSMPSESSHESIELDHAIEKPVVTNIDEAFTRAVNEFIEQYRPALDALAQNA